MSLLYNSTQNIGGKEKKKKDFCEINKTRFEIDFRPTLSN